MMVTIDGMLAEFDCAVQTGSHGAHFDQATCRFVTPIAAAGPR